MLELFRPGRSLNAGNMDAMAASFRRSAIFYGTKGRSLARRRKPHVPTAAQNLHERLYVDC